MDKIKVDQGWSRTVCKPEKVDASCCELPRRWATGREGIPAPEGDGDVGDDRGRRQRRKLRRSVIGGP